MEHLNSKTVKINKYLSVIFCSSDKSYVCVLEYGIGIEYYVSRYPIIVYYIHINTI